MYNIYIPVINDQIILEFLVIDSKISDLYQELRRLLRRR